MSAIPHKKASPALPPPSMPRALPLDGAPKGEPIDTVCCVCNKVAWNGPDGDGPRRWLDAAYYERTIRPLRRLISHGMCPDCFEDTWREAFPGTGGPPEHVLRSLRGDAA